MIIVLADRQSTEMVKALVKLDLPTPKGAGNIQVVYLANAEAEELAKVLSGLPDKGAPEGKQPGLSTEVKIVADKATNRLVITAEPEEFQVLDPVVEELDVPRKQVYVEALIMEVPPLRAYQWGCDWCRRRISLVVGMGSSSAAPTPPSLGVSIRPGREHFPVVSPGVLSFPFTIGGVTLNNLAAHDQCGPDQR